MKPGIVNIEMTKQQILSLNNIYDEVLFSSRTLWDDPEFVLSLRIDHDSETYCFISERLRNDESFVLELVQKNPWCLECCHPKFRANKRIVLEAVTRKGFLIKYVPEPLRNDPEIALAAVSQDGEAICYLSDDLKNNPEIARAAVRRNGRALGYLSDVLRNDFDTALIAVLEDSLALQYVSPTLTNNCQFRDAVTQKKGDSFQSLSSSFGVENEIGAAVPQIYTLLGYVPKTVWNKWPDIARVVVRDNGKFLCYFSDAIKNNFDIALMAALNNSDALPYVSYDLRNNRQFMRAVIQKDGRAFQWASARLRDDLELLCLAMATASVYEWASKNLRSSKKAVLEVIRLNPAHSLRYAFDEPRRDREVVLAAIQGDGGNIRYACLEFRTDKELMLIAINNASPGDWSPLRNAADELRADAELTYADYQRKNENEKFYPKLVAPKLLARINEYAELNKCPFKQAWGKLAYQEKIRNKPYRLYTEGATRCLLLSHPLFKKLPDVLCFYIGSFLLINSGGWQMALSCKKVLFEAICRRDENKFLPDKSREKHQDYQKENKCDEKTARRFFLLMEQMHTRSNMFYIAGATESVLGRSKLPRPVTHLISTFFVLNPEGSALARVDKESAETARRTRQTKCSPVIR